MRKLYHVTPEGNVQSILACGLVPAVGPRSAAFGEVEPAIYFFKSLDDVEDALSNWLGDELGEDGRIAVIEALLPNGTPAEEEAFEVRTKAAVPPCFLRIMDDSELPFAEDCGTEPAAAPSA